MKKIYSERFSVNNELEAMGGEEHLWAMDLVKGMKERAAKDPEPVDPQRQDRFLFLSRALSEVEELDVEIFREEGWLRTKYYAPEILLSRRGKELLVELLHLAEDAVLLVDREGKLVVTFYFKTYRESELPETE